MSVFAMIRLPTDHLVITDCDDFGECSLTCGGGERTCERSCENGSWGDAECPTSQQQNRVACNEQPCPGIPSFYFYLNNSMFSGGRLYSRCLHKNMWRRRAGLREIMRKRKLGPNWMWDRKADTYGYLQWTALPRLLFESCYCYICMRNKNFSQKCQNAPNRVS